MDSSLISKVSLKPKVVISDIGQVLKDGYLLEIGFMVLACLLFLNYYAGCAANKTLARLWVQHNVDIFEKQFHLVRLSVLTLNKVGINVEGAP